MSSGYYPAGAEYDPCAPWNMAEPEYMTCEHCGGEGRIYYDGEGHLLTAEQYSRLASLEHVYCDRCEHCGGEGRVEVEPFEPDYENYYD